jgi:hypothetical protein
VDRGETLGQRGVGAFIGQGAALACGPKARTARTIGGHGPELDSGAAEVARSGMAFGTRMSVARGKGDGRVSTAGPRRSS